ncbi:class I SAM-dependent methyltransferase [Bacillus sp. 3255]|uniref:class I SAM-dependent methyltransferase n=1 Tax=Bacillus sp. 3255 TaxID=2817904 RepID=UPI002861ACFD|nr:class I SAM-dependent methyltransferase [Bacillus sp. 3255]MDR6879745.1 SAM-dependent methyltransferase [Bacillus sp. 3255]
MKENKYDDSGFFEKYSQMARSIGGLDAAGEWPALRALLPELAGKNVLDLGCGYGWHCRYARERGAHSVVGLDLSEKMLQRAREMTNDSAITYRKLAIEDIDYEAGQFDVVISSLAIHYVRDFELLSRRIHYCLAQGGSFVLSVEHPVFTSRAEQDWHYDEHGEKMHWPIDHYQDEGERAARFLDHDVVKYHRTVASYMNTLLDAGFAIDRVSEPGPTKEALMKDPEMRHEARRPIFLLIAAVKK